MHRISICLIVHNSGVEMLKTIYSFRGPNWIMNVASSFAAKPEEYYSQVPVPQFQEAADEVGVFYCL